MDLSKLSTEELQALLAQARAKPKAPAKASAEDLASFDPTIGMSGMEKFLAGVGKAFVDTGRGLGNIVTDIAPGAAKFGFATRADTDEAKRLDAPLMETGAGLVGNIGGQIIPAVALPGATIPKAIASGAGLGFAQPVGQKDSRTMNMFMGGMFGGAVPTAAAVYKGARAFVEPIIRPQRTAARILEQFADDPQAMRLAAANAAELVPGSKPTLAQVTQQPGISSLERAAMNEPGPLQAQLTERMLEQNAARQAHLAQAAGTPEEIAMLAAARDRKANAVLGPMREWDAPPIDLTRTESLIGRLLDGEAGQRPKIAAKLKEVRSLLEDQGRKGTMNQAGAFEPELITDFTRVYGTRKAIGDMMDELKASGLGDSAMRELMTVRKSLDNDIRKSIPEFGNYLKDYAGASRGIDQKKVMQALRDKAEGDLPDKLQNRTLRAGPFARAMDDPATVRGATGFKRASPMDELLEPDQLAVLKNVRGDLERAHVAENLGKARGSPTAQYLTTQNLMREIAGPMGMPSGIAEKLGASLMATPVIGPTLQFAGKGMEQRVQRELMELLLDPKTASQAAALINAQSRLGRGVSKALPHLPAPLAASGLFAHRQE